MTGGIYSEEEMLQLSGIQHYVFCPRQWALIHIDQLWDDNLLTAEGTMLHSNVDNPFMRETDGTGTVTLRGIRVVSDTLGLSGTADAVELHPHKDAPKDKASLLKSRMFELIPVEYKRGRRKVSDCDRIQVAAQGMALEEMLGINVSRGAIFYWEERHREYFDIDASLRTYVREAVAEMHRLTDSKTLPEPPKRNNCRACSLFDSCMPSLHRKSALKYIDDTLGNDETE